MALLRRLMGVVIILGSLLYIPYALYSARTQRLIAESAVSVRGAVVRADEVTCKRFSTRHSKSYTCDVAVIADVNANPPWTGRVVIDTTSSPSKERAKELARERLATLKTRDALSLYAVTRGGEQDYISEDGLEGARRAGDPTGDVYLLFTPLFVILGVVAIVKNRG